MLPRLASSATSTFVTPESFAAASAAALAPEPARRLSAVSLLSEGVVAWLEGLRRREQALSLLEEAREDWRRWLAQEAELAQAERVIGA